MTMKWEASPFKSTMARARGLGSAKSGVKHWMDQRLTALANIPLVLWMMISVIQMHDASYDQMVAWMQNPVNAVLTLLFIVSTFTHALLGTQVITEDYCHHEGIKTLKLMLLKLYFIAAGTAGVFAVLRVALS